MSKKNAIGSDFVNNADGFTHSGGTTERSWTVTGGDVTATGNGSGLVHTFPSVTDTLAGISATQTITNKTIGLGTIFSATPVINDGIKWTFNPDSNLSGLNVGTVSGDVSVPANGDIWYDHTAHKYRCVENGTTKDLVGAGGGGSPGGSDGDLQYRVNSSTFGGFGNWDNTNKVFSLDDAIPDAVVGGALDVSQDISAQTTTKAYTGLNISPTVGGRTSTGEITLINASVTGGLFKVSDQGFEAQWVDTADFQLLARDTGGTDIGSGFTDALAMGWAVTPLTADSGVLIFDEPATQTILAVGDLTASPTTFASYLWVNAGYSYLESKTNDGNGDLAHVYLTGNGATQQVRLRARNVGVNREILLNTSVTFDLNSGQYTFPTASPTAGQLLMHDTGTTLKYDLVGSANLSNDAIVGHTNITPAAADRLLFSDAGTSLGDGSVRDLLNVYTYNLSGSIPDPTATDDIGIFTTDKAITITEVRTYLVAGTSVDFNITHGTNPTTGVDLWSADQTANTTTSVQTHSTSFNDATCAAGEAIRFVASAVSGAVEWFHITIFYTID